MGSEHFIANGQLLRIYATADTKLYVKAKLDTPKFSHRRKQRSFYRSVSASLLRFAKFGLSASTYDCFATTIVFIFLFLTIFSSSLLFGGVVSSTDLIKNSKEYDGKTVTYEGEVIGDVMQRGEYGWINVADGKDVIGIWCKKEDLNKIKFAGSYTREGDRIKAIGIFNMCCSQHQGGLDIHAQELEVVEPGIEITYPLNEGKAKLVGILAITALGFIFLSILRRSSIKKPPESAPPPV